MKFLISDIINKKRLAKELSKEEIKFMIDGFVSGSVKETQMAAFLMAICINGCSEQETFDITDAMLNSGEILAFPKNSGIFTDKHSTGGVSDTTTLILAPIVALSGLKFMKMSGKSLGHTGGTIDKLASFEGYNSELSIEEALNQTAEIGGAVIAQTTELDPADKKIYKLRDETSTVESLPLIAASIMSKKLASGTDVIVLDVKCGNGAFMDTPENAEELARVMTAIGKKYEKKVCCLVTDMNQPLGDTLGNTMEVIEAINILSGKKQSRLSELSFILAAKIISLGKNISYDDARRFVDDAIKSGDALNKLKDIVSRQGGSTNLFEMTESFEKNYLKSEKSGFIKSFDCKKLGNLARILEQNGKGLEITKKIGDKIEAGEILFTFFDAEADPEFLTCVEISDEPVKPFPLVFNCIE